jgi:hypothetical protein
MLIAWLPGPMAGVPAHAAPLLPNVPQADSVDPPSTSAALTTNGRKRAAGRVRADEAPSPHRDSRWNQRLDANLDMRRFLTLSVPSIPAGCSACSRRYRRGGAAIHNGP